jgi:hypothetical protein
MSLMPTATEPPPLPEDLSPPDEIRFAALGIITTQIQQVLSDELRIKKWRGHPNHLAGHCYTASEALYHLGGRDAGFRPLNIKHEDTSHWCLMHDDGTIIDPTVGQFVTVPDYTTGIRRGFLTRNPSRRAQTIIDRLSIQ